MFFSLKDIISPLLLFKHDSKVIILWLQIIDHFLIMRFYVYILFSISRNAYYIGYTAEDLKERIRKHNTNHNGVTGHIGEWMLMHYETFYSKADAVNREKQIKNWKSRKLIEKLINSEQPEL